jgi:hypothetical protein
MAIDLKDVKGCLDVEGGWNMKEGLDVKEDQTCLGDEKDYCQGPLVE